MRRGPKKKEASDRNLSTFAQCDRIMERIAPDNPPPKSVEKPDESVPKWKSDPNAWLCGLPVEKNLKWPVAINAVFPDPSDPTKIGVNDLLYGGAKGGGKTCLGLRLHIRLALLQPGRRTAVIRYDKKRLIPNTWRELMRCVRWLKRNCGLDFEEHRTDMTLWLKTSENDEEWPEFIGLEGKDSDKWQGINIDGAFVDEAVQHHHITFWEELADRMRGSEIGMERNYESLLVLASNPGSGYVYNEYYKPHVERKLGRWDEEKDPFKKYVRRAFIPATIEDNLGLRQDYKDRTLSVAATPRKIREQKGEWDADDGVVFVDRHADTFCRFDVDALVASEGFESNVVGGFDYGYNHKGAYFEMVVADGIVFVFREMVVKKKRLEEWASFMRQNRTVRIFADRTVTWQTRHGRKESIQTELTQMGIRVTPANEAANKAIDPGVQMMAMAFMQGLIRIHEDHCPKLVEAVTSWREMSDPANDDAFLEGEYEEEYKDEIDALRYALLNIRSELAWGEYENQTAIAVSEAKTKMRVKKKTPEPEPTGLDFMVRTPQQPPLLSFM